MTRIPIVNLYILTKLGLFQGFNNKHYTQFLRELTKI